MPFTGIALRSSTPRSETILRVAAILSRMSLVVIVGADWVWVVVAAGASCPSTLAVLKIRTKQIAAKKYCTDTPVPLSDGLNGTRHSWIRDSDQNSSRSRWSGSVLDSRAGAGLASYCVAFHQNRSEVFRSAIYCRAQSGGAPAVNRRSYISCGGFVSQPSVFESLRGGRSFQIRPIGSLQIGNLRCRGHST